MKRRRQFSNFQNETFGETLINLTPLIDVVFVVLIAFILIAPLLEIDRVDLASGSFSSESDPSHRSRISIYVREDNSIWLGKRLVNQKELVKFLQEKKKLMPSEIPQIYHDQKATFGTYQMVKSCVEEAGFSQMDIILKHK